MRRAFVFDQERCMGCNTCTVACKDWNQVNPGPVRWRSQYTYEQKETDANNPFPISANSYEFYPLAMSCNHCKEPACVPACGLDAIKRREDGVVYVDRTICQSLGDCIKACPFGAPQMADDQQEPEMEEGWAVKHPMQKCDFCIERLNQGQDPICVASCPANALDYGDYDELMQKYANKGIFLEPISIGEHPYAYKNNSDDSTEPSFLISRRRHTLEVVEAVKDDS